jgi:pyruvate dehydrogenase E2 component (dihydrolipoamide acetyltransferase)
MAVPIIMPKQGQSVETCIITRWFRKKGDKVSTGDILFSYETDKAAFDFESPADGNLLEIFFDEGAEVPVLVNVAIIGSPGESTESLIPSGETVKSKPPVPSDEVPEKKADMTPVIPAAKAPEEDNSRIRISPRARRLAAERGLNFSTISGSGPNGRIVVKDIEKALKENLASSQNIVTSSGSDFIEKPLSNVRKLIARAMHSSLQNSAQLTHHMSADVRRLLEARKANKEKMANGETKHDITLNDMVCWCVIRALEKFPEVNSHFLDDRIKTFSKVHLGIAVDTSRGLMVPVVRNASDMTIEALSRELKSVAEACKKGNINPELLNSGSASFTVSNLGNYGVEMFTPVINLPQAAILGVCTIIYRPADIGNNIIGLVPHMGLSLTYDHRAIDGGPATLFLREIKNQMENFSYR